MSAEEIDVGVGRTGRALLMQVANVFRHRDSWRTSTVSEDLEARLRAAPAAADAVFIDAALDVERPQVDDDPRSIAAIIALAVRLTPVARQGLLTLATRARGMDADSAEFETLERSIGRMARDFLPEIVAFIKHHPGDLGGLPAMVVREDRLDATLLDVLLARLEDNPRNVAFELGYFKDPRVLPALSDRLARLAREETFDWASAALNLAEAVVELGGQLTKQQKADLKHAETIRSAGWDQRNEAERSLRDRVDEGRRSTRRFRLDELARDPSGYVRAAVGSNKSTGDVTLAALAGDRSIEVRRAVADNPSTCEATLTALANDAAIDVREAVAGNPRAPESVQLALSKDPELGVRVAVAQCQDVYPSACVLLVEDQDPSVRSGIVATAPIAMVAPAVSDPAPEVRRVVAARHDLAVAQFETLVNDADADVRCEVAFNENAPAAVLERLVNDERGSTAKQAKQRLAELAAKEAAANAPWSDEELPTPPDDDDDMD